MIDLDGNFLPHAAGYRQNTFLAHRVDELAGENYASRLIVPTGSAVFLRNLQCPLRGAAGFFGYVHVAHGNIELDVPRGFRFEDIRVMARYGCSVDGQRVHFKPPLHPHLTDDFLGTQCLVNPRNENMVVRLTPRLIAEYMRSKRYLTLVCSTGNVAFRTAAPGEPHAEPLSGDTESQNDVT